MNAEELKDFAAHMLAAQRAAFDNHDIIPDMTPEGIDTTQLGRWFVSPITGYRHFIPAGIQPPDSWTPATGDEPTLIDCPCQAAVAPKCLNPSTC